MKSRNCCCQIITVLAILALLPICPTVPTWGQTKVGEHVSIKRDQQEVTSEKLINPEDIMMGFEEGQATVKVIVNLAQPLELLAATDWDAVSSLNALHAEIQTRQEEVLSTLSLNEFTLRRRFENQAGFSGEVTPEGLDKLLDDPRVKSVELVYILELHLAQGISLINASGYRPTYNGQGVAIAICDTGIDYTHPKLGGGGFPNSKVIGGYDTGNNDLDPMPQGDAHGTCCAGIAAGDLDTIGDYIGGVAYNAKLYAMKIIDSGGDIYNDYVIAAWDWCVSHKNDNPSYPILVVSNSIGGGRYYSLCDNSESAFATAANNLVAAGITVLVSSGNDGYCDSIGRPACLSNTISVGAVYDSAFGTHQPCVKSESCATKNYTSSGCWPFSNYYAIDDTSPDMVTSYSNTASFLDILAPANETYTTDITGSVGYSTGDYYDSFGGTSAACPYAAGAVACLQSAAKAKTGSYFSPSEVRNILIATGDDITDGKVAITKPRLNLGQAIDSIGPPDNLRIAPTEEFNSSGDEGGPFTPPCKTYTLTNVNDIDPLNWTATATQPWIDVTPGSGTLADGASTTVDVCINANATSLPIGNYNDTVTFTNTTSGITKTQQVTLEVRLAGIIFSDDMESGTNNWSLDYPWGLTTSTYNSPSHSLTDSPAGYYSNSRNISATLIPEIDLSDYKSAVLEFQTKYFTESCCDRGYIEVSTNGGLSWPSQNQLGYVRGTQSYWTKKSYPLDQFLGQNIRIRFRLNTDHSITDDGWYIDDVAISGEAIDCLVVTAAEPPEEFISSGDEEGPFIPSCKSYTLRNDCDTSLGWDANATCNWVDIIPSSGTLSPGQTTAVEICFNNDANDLYPGIYTCKVTFTNTDTGYTQQRDVTLEVINVPGEIEVTDSIPEPNDLAMPFGRIVVGMSQTGQITIANIDPNQRHEITIEDIYLDSAPYWEDFSSGRPGSSKGWEYYEQGDIVVVSGRLRMKSDSSSSYYDLNEAIWHLDLAGKSNVVLSFWQRQYGEEAHYLPATFTGHSNDDGVAISEEGDKLLGSRKWYTIVNASELSTSGKTFTVDLDDEVERIRRDYDPDFGYSGNFCIKFQQYDNYSSEYREWDDIYVYSDDAFELKLPPGGPHWILDANNPTLVVDVNFAPTDFRDYAATVIIKSDDRDEPNVVVHLSGTGIPDHLDITPEQGLASSGPEEGPFTPDSETYTLTNNGDTSIGWDANATCHWVDIIPSSGMLSPGQITVVEICFNNDANDLYPGIYDCNVVFTNTNSGFVQTRNVTLEVINVLGWIEVTDSIPEPNDHNMPFGEVVVGLSWTEQVTITNIDSNSRHEVTIEDIYLDGRPYLEDFDDGQAQDWEPDPSAYWSVYSQRYRVDAYYNDFSGYTQSIYTAETWKNATVEMDVQCSYRYYYDGYDRNYAGVILRATDDFNIRSGTGSAYLVFIRGNRYYRVSKFVDGVLIDIKYWTYSSQLNSGTSNNKVKVVFEGSDFDIYFNSYPYPVWTGSDSDISDADHIGLVAYRYSSSSDYDTYFHFDDVNVYSDDAFSIYPPPSDDGNDGIWTLNAGESMVVDVNFVPTDFIDYNSSEIVIKTNDPNNPEVRISMSGIGIKDYIVIVPLLEDGPTEFAGHPGGPFMPTNSTYVVKNNGHIDVNWSVNGPNWVDVSPSSGTLEPNGFAIVTVWPNDVADTIPEGIYDANLIFIDETTTMEQEREIRLVVYTTGKICVEPVDFDIPVPQGNIVTEILTIGNCGDANLSYTVSSDELWLGISQYMGTVEPGGADQITVTFDGNREVGTYDDNLSITSNDPYNMAFDIPAKMSIIGVDYFTEIFDQNDNDVSNLSVTFTPDESGSYYRACGNMVSEFPVDPDGGTIVPLVDDDYAQVRLDGIYVNLYGIDYNTFYIGSNGFVTFVSGDIRYFENIPEHFNLPRIAGLWDDLDPSSGGTVSWKQLVDRIAVTFEGVPELYTANSNSFQVEMFYDGYIRITWLSIAATDGLVGLSQGNGEPAFNGESDMSGYSACTPMAGDLSNDFHVDFFDLAIFSQCWKKYERIMETVRDEFNAVDYSGNDGSLNWSNNWIEYGEVDGPAAGILQVSDDGVMRIGSKGTIIGQFNWSLTREADLGTATTATLRFNYATKSFGSTGFVNVQVSDDGGFNWYTLAVYPHNAGSGSASYDISSWISSNTQIRFEVDPSVKIKMFFDVDNVEIEYGNPDQPWYLWCNGSDFNRNFKVDADDLMILCEHWLE
jgi:hypothetical protein